MMPDQTATLYLRCRSGDVAPLVLLTGDPARVERIAEMLDNGRVVSRNREYVVATGGYKGQPISAVSAGIGAPSTAIALEELKRLGLRAVVRVGTMMGVHAPMGTTVIATGSARFEGTSGAYLPLAYPAIPDWSLSQVLATAGRTHNLDVRLGLTITQDAFYPDMAPSLVDRGALNLDIPRRAGALALDMESSLVCVMGMTLGFAAAIMCLVTVQAEPFTVLASDQRATLEGQLITAVLEGLIAFNGS
ncbi:MAG: nucleoside phosphorylase [Anaerolineae bacterium]|nr:nucleoside phosphorylase [Anaerolineae bacterium]